MNVYMFLGVDILIKCTIYPSLNLNFSIYIYKHSGHGRNSHRTRALMQWPHPTTATGSMAIASTADTSTSCSGNSLRRVTSNPGWPAVPAGVASTNCMPSLLDEEKMLLKVMGREEGRSWAFVYLKSKGRSTLTGQAWRFFVTSKQLGAGDVVKFSWSVLYYLIDIVKKKDGRSHVDRLTMEAEEKVAGAAERRPRQKKTMKKVFGVWLEFE